MKTGVLAALLLASLPATLLPDEASRSYALPWGGSLQVPVPEGWQDKTASSSEPRAFTITLIPPAGRSFAMLIITALPPSAPRSPGQEDLRAAVEQRGRQLLATAVEKELRIEELQGGAARGYYYSLTDRAPKPGEYEYLTQGAATVGDVSLTFTLLSNAPHGPLRQAGLDLLRGTRPGPSAR